MSNTPRFLPRVKLYNRQRAANKALLQDLVTKDLMRSTVASPAQRAGISFLKLDGDKYVTTDTDKFVATLDYKINWVDTGLSDWLRYPSDAENLYRSNARTALNLDLAAESAKNPPDTDKIKSLQATLSLLSDGHAAYLEEHTDLMGSSTSGIWWILSAPNIPVTFKSTFAMEKNRAFSLRLQRGLKPIQQADYSFTIEFGNGTTLYAIVIGDDGNRSTFIHYRNMDPDARQKLIDQREALLDYGRLTAADMADIYDKTQIINDKDNPDVTQDDIKAAKLAIKTLKESKKLTAAQQDQINKLENQLYIKKDTFTLQEDSSSLLGQSVDITVSFLRAGYVTINCDKTTFIYENTHLTGWRPAGYHDGLPDGSQIAIKSTGGDFAIVYGHPEYQQKGILLTQPFPVDFDPSSDDLSIDEDADYDGAGSDIEYDLITYQAPQESDFGATQPGQYQIQATFSSDGTYTPELFAAQMHIPPPSQDSLEQIWDSQVQGAGVEFNSGNHILDVLLEDNHRDSRLVTLHIDNAFNKSNLPVNMSGLAVDVVLLDRNTGDNVELLRGGKVLNGYQRDRHGFSGDSPIKVAGLAIMSCIGLEAFLDKEIAAKTKGDNKYPNDYLIELCIDGGLLPSEYSGIGTGDIGLPIIPRSAPGQPPAVKPGDGTKYWEWMLQVVDKHCLGWELYGDGTKLVLAQVLTRDKTAKNYQIPPAVAIADPLCIRDEVSTEQSVVDYLTTVTVVGAKDQLTGKRLKHTESIPQANDKRFLNSAYYVGDEYPLILPDDDSLTNPTDLVMVARNRLQISNLTPGGVTPWFANIQIDFDPDMRAGDVVKLFGKKCIVDAVQFGSLNAGDGERIQVKLQLAEDWT